MIGRLSNLLDYFITVRDHADKGSRSWVLLGEHDVQFAHLLRSIFSFVRAPSPAFSLFQGLFQTVLLLLLYTSRGIYISEQTHKCKIGERTLAPPPNFMKAGVLVLGVAIDYSLPVSNQRSLVIVEGSEAAPNNCHTDISVV